MVQTLEAFSGFSVRDLAKAKDFYTMILGLQVDQDEMGLHIHLPGSKAKVFVYSKDDHQPATYTMLNFVVPNIDAAADELISAGVVFEKYEGSPQDAKGIMRGKSNNMGPDIAWFKDPSDNILSILQN